jgi:hypothetical protein
VEKQVWGVKHLIGIDMEQDRNSVTLRVYKDMTINAEAGNRAGEHTDIGEVMTEVIESR